MRKFLILGSILALVAGCGSKGPLVMPLPPKPVANAPAKAPTASPADDSSKPAEAKP